jgi:hypothetical protein
MASEDKEFFVIKLELPLCIIKSSSLRCTKHVSSDFDSHADEGEREKEVINDGDFAYLKKIIS